MTKLITVGWERMGSGWIGMNRDDRRGAEGWRAKHAIAVIADIARHRRDRASKKPTSEALRHGERQESGDRVIGRSDDRKNQKCLPRVRTEVRGDGQGAVGASDRETGTKSRSLACVSG